VNDYNKNVWKWTRSPKGQELIGYYVPMQVRRTFWQSVKDSPLQEYEDYPLFVVKLNEHEEIVEYYSIEEARRISKLSQL
jgi:hypothetical protein